MRLMIARIAVGASVIACAAIASLASAAAQTFPAKPIRLMVGFPPGGSTDVLARTLAQEARSSLGEVVVINKAGAAGTVVISEIVSSAPDGYTIGITPSTALTLAHQFQNIRQDLLESTDALLMVGRQRVGMATSKDSPHKTLKDFIAAARSNPGKLSLGIPGAGTSVDLMLRALLAHEKVDANIVPFQGDAPVVTALLGGHITAGAFAAGGWAPQVRDGALRLLASFEADRADVAPDVPTLAELGYGLKGNAIQYLLAPKGLPAPVSKKLIEAFLAASQTPGYVDIAQKNALYDKATTSGAMLDRQLLADRAELAALVDRLGLKKK